MPLWFWCVLTVFVLILALFKIAPKYISDRGHCFKNCFYFRNNECYFYGKGHLAKYPCNEYMERNKILRRKSL